MPVEVPLRLNLVVLGDRVEERLCPLTSSFSRSPFAKGIESLHTAPHSESHFRTSIRKPSQECDILFHRQERAIDAILHAPLNDRPYLSFSGVIDHRRNIVGLKSAIHSLPGLGDGDFPSGVAYSSDLIISGGLGG